MIWLWAAVTLWVAATIGAVVFIYGATKGRDRVSPTGDRQQPSDER